MTDLFQLGGHYEKSVGFDRGYKLAVAIGSANGISRLGGGAVFFSRKRIYDPRPHSAYRRVHFVGVEKRDHTD
jgi:hypothetical protein